MSKLLAALQAKYRTPADALRALGMDANLLKQEWTMLKFPKLARDQDPDVGGGTPPTNEEIVSFLEIMLSKASDPQDLLNQIASFVSNASQGAGSVSVGSGDGIPANNRSAVTTAGDRRRGAARDSQRAAQDASLAIRQLNHAAFEKRFGSVVKGVDVWGRR